VWGVGIAAPTPLQGTTGTATGTYRWLPRSSNAERSRYGPLTLCSIQNTRNKDVARLPHPYYCPSRIPTDPIPSHKLSRYDTARLTFPSRPSLVTNPNLLFAINKPGTTMNAIFCIPEIVILVFQGCDGLQDVMALASTCKYIASIWRLYSSCIIWPLAKAEIPGFSQALMAVRLSKSETIHMRSALTWETRPERQPLFATHSRRTCSLLTPFHFTS
jgi:hypothetical protein